MSVVTLVSGGLDSSVMAALTVEEAIVQYPLFIDYGQLGATREWLACRRTMKQLHLAPTKINISGFGKVIPSGLTNRNLRINEDAFLPGRNLLFLLVGAALAYRTQSAAVAIGLLDEKNHVFPDQTATFLRQAESTLRLALGYSVSLIAPLITFTKADILALAKARRLSATYSCHSGRRTPCGKCISCREIAAARQ